MTLVFFIVFFNVYQGVQRSEPGGARERRACWAPARGSCCATSTCRRAMSWVFSSLHTSVGLAFVGAVVGRIPGLGERSRLPHPAGRGRLRHRTRCSPGILRADRLRAAPRLRRWARSRSGSSCGGRGRRRPSSSDARSTSQHREAFMLIRSILLCMVTVASVATAQENYPLQSATPESQGCRLRACVVSPTRSRKRSTPAA